MGLDYTDIQILKLLQHDCLLSNKEIADKLSKTVTPILMRKRRLEEQGYIKKYIAILDRHKLNMSLMAYTNVQLKEHAETMLHAFQKAVIRFDEVLECNHMTGNYDYLLKIVVADMNHYHQFIVEKLAKLPNIGTVQSSFVMAELKEEYTYAI